MMVADVQERMKDRKHATVVPKSRRRQNRSDRLKDVDQNKSKERYARGPQSSLLLPRRMTTIDREKIAPEWVARGFGCELWSDPPGERWVDFSHRTDELVCVPGGQM